MLMRMSHCSLAPLCTSFNLRPKSNSKLSEILLRISGKQFLYCWVMGSVIWFLSSRNTSKSAILLFKMFLGLYSVTSEANDMHTLSFSFWLLDPSSELLHEVAKAAVEVKWGF